MGYKKSDYNIVINTLEDGSTLLYNSFSGAFGILRKEIQNIYENIESIYIENLEQEVCEKINVMIANGFIVNNNFDEYGVMQVRERVARYSETNTKSLTIAPTLGCNMNCPYCYEEKNNVKMDDDIKKSLVDFVKKYIQGSKGFNVSWYGGEPLLEKETIKQLSSEFIKICDDYKIAYSAAIVTNGILLDRETAQMLKNDCNVRMAQITIDGIGDVHNKRRRLKNNGDSFKIITENIEEVSSIMPISIRVNIDKTNVDEINKLISFFLEEKQWHKNGNVRFYFAPVMNVTDACTANQSSCFNMDEFGEILSKVSRKIYNMGHMKIMPKFLPPAMVTGCAALSLNTYVVDPKGDLYKCWDIVGIEKHKVGNVKSGIELNREHVQWLTLEKPEACKSCSYVPICQGGCPFIRMRNNNKEVCAHDILQYKENFKIVYEQYISEKRTS
ncbi:radical SAM/SPASM domain-containing protein [Clostridium sp. UBA4548]|uniref:radical SAM/SPASM domain-containing protein n=1 Tax=Clostridium sp. UBA4548 TaxID=1946361 RepID=UPI0025C16E5F|nr:SPASM domain-containing protein [Clostridium sp. UBA4548]